jgi:hypothetical protein
LKLTQKVSQAHVALLERLKKPEMVLIKIRNGEPNFWIHSFLNKVKISIQLIIIL